jgi:L-threonylcarbamoyladenylate synthase
MVTTKIEKIDPDNPEEELLDQAARLIKRSKVIVCPTDTGYAFAANALDKRAIAAVFNLKGRSFSNPIHIAVGSIKEAENYANVTEAARYLASQFFPGALTLVLSKKDIVPSILVAGLETIGIRVPDNRVILKLTEKTGFPLTTTSANVSGKPGTYSVEEIITQFGEKIRDVDLILDQGALKVREVSTIVDLTVDLPQLIRQGRVSWLEVHEALNRLQKAK